MKTILIIIAIVIIGWVGYTILNDENTDVPTQETSSETANTDTMDDTAEPADSESAEETTAVDAEIDIDLEAGDGEVREFTLDSFNYGYSETELRVNEGDTVVITLTNSDGFHDWVLDEFDAATEKIQEGDTTTVTFVASEAGTYEYYCSVGSHRAQGMVGTLVVE